jgi:hypothetical protein
MYPQEFQLTGIFKFHFRVFIPGVFFFLFYPEPPKAKKTMNQQAISNTPNAIQFPARYFHVSRK